MSSTTAYCVTAGYRFGDRLRSTPDGSGSREQRLTTSSPAVQLEWLRYTPPSQRLDRWPPEDPLHRCYPCVLPHALLEPICASDDSTHLPSQRNLFKAVITRVLSRINTVTGIQYRRGKADPWGLPNPLLRPPPSEHTNRSYHANLFLRYRLCRLHLSLVHTPPSRLPLLAWAAVRIPPF